MAAGYSELFMEQGATFNVSVGIDDVNGAPYDLTDFIVSSQMRKSYYSSSETATFVTSTGTDPTQGIITLSLEADSTANIFPGRYVFDVYLTNLDQVRIRILEGVINVSPQATKLPGMI